MKRLVVVIKNWETKNLHFHVWLLAIFLQNLAKRRGSAPISLPLSRPEDRVLPAGGGLTSDIQALRRGSVPIEIARKYKGNHA